MKKTPRLGRLFIQPSFPTSRMHTNRQLIHFYWLFGLALFSSTSLQSWLPGYDWYDQQRLGQLILLLIACPLALSKPPNLSPKTILLIGIFFCLGAISSISAKAPSWALKEWSIYAGLLLLSFSSSSITRNQTTQNLVFMAITACGTVFAAMFYTYYIIALSVKITALDPYLLVYGFDNPRFLGQFQILLIPILAGLSVERRSSISLSVFLLIILILQWSIAWSLAGRGFLLAVLLSSFSLLIIHKRKHFRLIITLAATALAGLLLFSACFIGIPALLEIPHQQYDSLRVDLSKRDTIWLLALNMTIESPWIGAGPMHFAAARSHIAAHPHQIFLQLLAEWGAPATISAATVILYSFRKAISAVRASPAPMDAALWISLSGGLLLAQVDGVLVTPYTQGWLAILSGVALARWAEGNDRNCFMKILILPLLLMSFFICGEVVLSSIGVVDFSQKHMNSGPPRYWGSGWIY
ncbi:O-antigen ligase family protein [Stutzerimonas chloritidismutans]|uniref:O-antigen ligase family protein n=1 Tax=Stutzerimonas chloritidismutans TaxID=203192 RepID=UPI0030DFD5AA